MPINWRRKQWRQQAKAQRQRKQQGKPITEGETGNVCLGQYLSGCEDSVMCLVAKLFCLNFSLVV